VEFNGSKKLFREAQQYMPGGVNSPVRAFKSVGTDPLFITKGKGSRIYDSDDNEFIDYVCSWGPLIVGHCHPQVVDALKIAVERGTSFGAPTELETELAKLIHEAFPAMEMLRLVNSGTEATMSAIRLARAFTGRNKVIKFAGGYHGHSDGLLAKAGSGLATLAIAESPGVPASYVQHTLVVPYNDAEEVERVFQLYPGDIAAVIVEPVAANMGVVPPKPGFLQQLRQLTAGYEALLIFDEVITGFRLTYGGAQTLFEIQPDLTCLGKIIGGGLPVGAYGGRKDIMQMVAPLGQVYQAGTLSGNPLATTAGITTLKMLREKGVYDQLEERASQLAGGIAQLASTFDLRVQVNRLGSILTVFFNQEPVINYNIAQKSDLQLYSNVFRNLLREGIYWPPSQFEAAFVSTAHGRDAIDKTIYSFEKAFKSVASL
jgi:glutamate-1-semialdehyde 2,1-aminomutase